jgi:hypothetical protein
MSECAGTLTARRSRGPSEAWTAVPDRLGRHHAIGAAHPWRLRRERLDPDQPVIALPHPRDANPGVVARSTPAAVLS